MKLKNFFRALRVNLINVVLSNNFVIAVFIIFAVLFAEIAIDVFSYPWRQPDPSGIGDAYCFNIALHFGYYIYAAPLACAFASGGLFCSDVEAGFYRLRLMKSGKAAYKYSLFIGATLGGGLALMAGVLLFAVSCAIVFLPDIPATNITAMVAWLPVVSNGAGNWNYMLINALLAFIFGMIWSGVGLVFSVLSRNRYISYLAPFIVCFSSLLILPAQWQPSEMLVQMNWESFTFPKLVAYQSALYIGVLIIYTLVFERKVIHEQG